MNTNYITGDERLSQISDADVADFVSGIRPASLGADEEPVAEWTRGTCPECGKNPLVSNMYYLLGKGYLILHECADSLRVPSPDRSGESVCRFYRVI